MKELINDKRVENICDVDIMIVNNENDFALAAECIADCFTGINVNGSIKYEPMNYVLEIKKEVSANFFLNLMMSIGDNGLCIIAKDIKTGIVVGALMGEIYDPNFNEINFTGVNEPYNHIFRFLDDLDYKFNEYIERTTKKEIMKNQYLHLHAIAVKVKGKNANIFKEIISKSEKWALERRLKGLFAEATNQRSQSKFIDSCDFIIPEDSNGYPIKLLYDKSDVFRMISPETALDCKLVYKKLDK